MIWKIYMFKKSPSAKHFDMFNKSSGMMCSLLSRYCDNISKWNKKPNEEITLTIPEAIFKQFVY